MTEARAMRIALEEPIRQFLTLAQFDTVVPRHELEDGVGQLVAEIERFALDAHTAIARRVPFADAVTDWVNFPQLARMHAALEDILTRRLPRPLQRWANRMFATPLPDMEGLRTALVLAAATEENPHLRALARFVLFEGVRINLLVDAKLEPHEIIGAGVVAPDLDDLAEEHVDRWLAEAPAVPEGVRPFEVIVAAARIALREHACAVREHLAQVHRDLLEAAQRRAELESELNEMEVGDALLVRNELAPHLDEQQLGREHLRERHPVAFGDVGANALDKQARRLLDRAERDGHVRRRGGTLLDILRKAAKGDVK
jgi:hypothetical protein